MYKQSEFVKAALGKVQASSQGSETFASWDDARHFEEAIYDRFPAGGYGTSTEMKAVPGGFTVAWRVYSAD